MPRVLIIGPSWVGDMVMAQALAKRLKGRGDDPEIHMVGPPWALPIAARMPEITGTHALDVRHGDVGLGRRWRLGRDLARIGFDEAIILPRSLKAALVPLFAGIPIRRGLIGEARVGLINRIVPLKAKEGRTVDEFVAMAGLGLHPLRPGEEPVLRADPAKARAVLDALGVSSSERVAVLCPGAEYGPAKRWPAVAFARLARRLASEGYQVQIVGSAKDAAIAAEILAAAEGTAVDLTGRTTLDQAVDVIAAAHVVISNDSGLMHVAAAVGRPLVALFGSSSPVRTPPLLTLAVIVTTEEQLACRPCFARECRFGHLACLTSITPERVAGLALDQAASTASARSTAVRT